MGLTLLAQSCSVQVQHRMLLCFRSRRVMLVRPPTLQVRYRRSLAASSTKSVFGAKKSKSSAAAVDAKAALAPFRGMEAFCIVHTANLDWMLERGIPSPAQRDAWEASGMIPSVVHLSNAGAKDRRNSAALTLPNGEPLRNYAHAFLNARNAALYQLLSRFPREKLAVLAIALNELPRLNDSFLSDGDASFADTRFHEVSELARASSTSSTQLQTIRANATRGFWRSADDSRRTLMAELLHPSPIPPTAITRVIAPTVAASHAILSLERAVSAVCPHLRRIVPFAGEA